MEARDKWRFPFDGSLVRPYMTADCEEIAGDSDPLFAHLDGLRGLITYRRTPRNGDHK
ncbi:hypothetical protein GKJPGBOP_06472 [Streptomyces paromomycinus]|uniref:Uncharacterized protein n=1 Tax=Streptomyces paromomycinus TaxID=92743 RepID=A0A401WBP3_STREY|nr:hypothetical protein GKJPGBOP_06472 [Streptomyces paromomycinus]